MMINFFIMIISIIIINIIIIQGRIEKIRGPILALWRGPPLTPSSLLPEPTMD